MRKINLVRGILILISLWERKTTLWEGWSRRTAGKPLSHSPQGRCWSEFGNWGSFTRNTMFALLKYNVGNKEDEKYLVALVVNLSWFWCPFLYIVVTLRSTSRQQKNTGYNNNSCFSCLVDPSLWLNVPGSRYPTPLWWWFRRAFSWPLSPPSPHCQYCCPCPHRTPRRNSLKIVKSIQVNSENFN